MIRYPRLFYFCALFTLALWPAEVPQAEARLHLLVQLPRPVPRTRINVANEPGSDLGEKLGSCVRRLVPEGGTCDALSLTGRQVVGVDPFVQNVGPLRVLLGKVTVEMSRGLDLPNDIELAGQGSDTTLRLAPGVNSDLIRNAGGAQGNHGIFIHDLTLDANGATRGGLGSTIHLQNVSGFTIERVTVLNSMVHGIALDHGCTHGRLLNNRIENVSRGSGIYAGSAAPAGPVSFLDISGNKIANIAKANGILVFGASPGGEHTHDVNIVENSVAGVKGISIEIGDGSQKVTVAGNKIELKGAPGGSSGATGIVVRSARNVKVTNNVISGDAAEHDQLGMRAWSPVADKGGPLLDVTMSENDVSDIAGFGILVDSGSAVHLVRNKVRRSAKDNIRIDPKATGVTQAENDLH
jgi:parallel beta helix pectate lyase-like protein